MINDEQLKKILLELDLVTEDQFGQAQKQAQKQGMTLMIEDGIDKTFNGLTTIEEIMRVTR